VYSKLLMSYATCEHLKLVMTGVLVKCSTFTGIASDTQDTGL
jgi:hypothetical protein